MGQEKANNAAEAAEPSPGASWIRPTALVLAALSVVGAAWLVWRYLDTYGATAAAPDTPPLAVALVLAVIAVSALAVVVLQPERGDLWALVATTVAVSVALLIALVLAWIFVFRSDQQNAWRGVPVMNMAEVDAYLARSIPPGVEPILIPTGVLLQSMEFLTGDNVQVTGYVWQRFGPEVPEELNRGVVLAEGIKEAYDTKEAYRYKEDAVETIGWYFAATLRQPFEYAEFPFDEQNAWLRLWARDFSQDVILVPDFAAYNSANPTVLPGVEHEFVYSGWSPKYSGFSYVLKPYDTSFGIGDAGQYPGLPELYFNLVLERNFVGPFFEHFTFAIAAAVLLFGLLLLTTNDEDLKGRFQLSTAGVLGAATGLLFAVILKHSQLRGVGGTRGVTYIEVIPMILYGSIVFVVLNAILLASPVKVRFFEHRNNLLPKLAYWPVVLGLLLAVTLAVLFRT